jgi:ribose transport system substrate-binding protein
MKKFLASIILAAVCVTAFAGGNEEKVPKTSKDNLNVYMVTLMSGGAAWGQAEKGFLAACKANGWTGRYLAPQVMNSETDIVNLVDTALTNGADVLCPIITTEEAFTEVLTRARAKGIPVIAIAAGSPKLADALVGTSGTAMGHDVANALVKAMGNKPIRVVSIQTQLTASIQNDQRNAFEAKLKELRPDAVVVAREECNSNTATAADKLNALQLSHPEINCLVSFDTAAGLGGAAVVEEKRLQGKFTVIGVDDSAEILRAVKAGTMACTVAQQWYEFGVSCVNIAKDLMDKKEVSYDHTMPTAIIFPQDVDAWAKKYGIDLSE